MEPRLNLQTIEPGAFQAMLGLEKYLSGISLDKLLIDLIKIRASQLNGCAYCIQMHTEDARSLGETEQRLYALSAWKESPLFSEQERAVLALTDEVTQISKEAVTEQTYQLCQQYLSDHEIAQCIMQIVQINSWNRIALATKMVFD
jgi:AhpD family alkylhydroperoxidase